MIEQIIHKLLRTSTPVTAKVSSDRIYYAEFTKIEPYELPAIVVERGSQQGRPTLKGGGSTAWGFARVTALASSYLGAVDLADLIRNRLDGFAGDVEITLEDDSTYTSRVGHLLLDDQSDISSDHKSDTGQILTHGVQIDFQYQHTIPAPTLA